MNHDIFLYLCTVFNVESEVGKFDAYIVPLKALTTGSHTFDYQLDNGFFTKIDSPEVRKGNIHATVVVKKTGSIFELSFDLDGVALIPCDRCLDDMEQPIACKEKLQVKLGKDFSEESEVVIVPEVEGEINRTTINCFAVDSPAVTRGSGGGSGRPCIMRPSLQQ